MNAAQTTLHCLRGPAPTPNCLCKLQKLSLILEASKLEAFEYTSANDTIVVYDNCLNPVTKVEDFLQTIDYANSIEPEYRPKVKHFFQGNVGQPVHSKGTKLDNGQPIHCVMQGMLLPDENNNNYVILGTIKDITSFTEKEEQLEKKSQLDPLTGLYNHAYGIELITQALLAKNPFDTCAFVIVDLDFFKQINDTYGHLFGDHVLTETAHIFKDVLPSDTIISRFGGDEFILFFPNISKIDLIQHLNRLMQYIHEVEMLNDTDTLGCSMGICFLPENTSYYTYDQLLENADTVQRYLEILERYNVDPSLVEIELTETVAAQNYAKVCQLFEQLREAGIKTSLDDFGAGYSLVNMVVDIPIDTIKIDRTLLLNCENTVKGQIFLKNTIAMLHSLGYSIICEGVETNEQRQLLLDCGCGKGQGYLFSRPIPISEYEARFYESN